MNINIEQGDGQMILNIKGKINNSTNEQFKSTLLEIVEKGTDLVLNFEETNFINSSGLRALLIAVQRLEANGKTLFVKNVNEVISEVFEMTGFDDMFVMI